MAIQQIGSNNPAALDSSLKPQAETLHSSKSYNAANSSLVSLSQSQEEGLGDFLSSFASGVWSLVTWPFRTLGSIWSWMTGAKDESSDKSESAKDKKSGGGSGGGKVSEAASDLLAAFKKDEDFDSDKVKGAYGAMSTDEKRNFRTMMWVAGGHKTVESGNKDWATRLIGKKGEFDESEETLLASAADMYKAAPRLNALSRRMADLANKMLEELNDEDSDSDFAKDLENLQKEFNKLPKSVQQRVKGVLELFPAQMLLSRKEADREDDRTQAAKLKGQAYVMEHFAKNSYLLVGDADARRDLERMLRIIGQKGFSGQPSGLARDEEQLDLSSVTRERRQKRDEDELQHDERPSASLLDSSSRVLPSKGQHDEEDVREVRSQHERLQMPRRELRAGVTEGEFVREYKQLGKVAQQAFAEAVGHIIGRPKDGEKYMMGTLVLDGKKQVPDVRVLTMALGVLVGHDGSEVPPQMKAVFQAQKGRGYQASELSSEPDFSSRVHRDEEQSFVHGKKKKGSRRDQHDELSFASPYGVDPRQSRLPQGMPFSMSGHVSDQYAQHLQHQDGGRGRGLPQQMPFGPPSFDPHAATQFGFDPLQGQGRGFTPSVRGGHLHGQRGGHLQGRGGHQELHSSRPLDSRVDEEEDTEEIRRQLHEQRDKVVDQSQVRRDPPPSVDQHQEDEVEAMRRQLAFQQATGLGQQKRDDDL